jgi:hypothetical protein
MRAATQPGGFLWPELRIGRRADWESMSQSVDDWNHFLNHSAALNRRVGLARPLSTLEVHYVTDTEIQRMVLAKMPALEKDRIGAEKTYASIRRNLKSFITEIGIVGHTLEWAELCERPELMGKTHGIDPSKIFPKRSQFFRAATFATRTIEQNGIIGYDGNVFGLDLSRQRSLYEERNDIVNFLKTDEGLDTKRFVRGDWEAHATLFQVSPHLRATDMSMIWPPELPEHIELGPVQDLSKLG